MAAIFQLRRGSGSVSLTDGELYLNKTSQSLQLGTGNSGQTITLAKMNDENIGSFLLTGDIKLSGSIYLGNESTDNISALGVFNTNLVPQNNTIDIGTISSQWRNVYANSISGAIAATNGVISGSTQITNGSGILSSSNSNFSEYTSSTNQFTSSANLRLGSLETKSASVDTSISNINQFTSSTNTRLSNLETTSASVNTSISEINSYTASLNNAIQLTGSTVSFLGDIVVYGTQSVINSVNLEVADNMIYLNATSSTTNVDLGIIGNYNPTGQPEDYAHTGIYRDSADGVWRVFKGYTQEPSGNIDLSDPSFTYADFYANALSASTLSGIGNVTAYSTAVDSRFDTIEGKYITTGSNNFVGNQTITGSLIVTGSNIELKRDWPVFGTESHFFRLSPFTSSTNRYYDGLSIGVEHWDDGSGTYEHSLLIHSFDDDVNQNYGAELNVGPYRTHMRVYPSGSNGTLANVSVQELTNGKSQALVYGDYIQIGAFVGEEILIGNTGSLITITGSNMLLDTPLTSSEAIVASLFSGSVSGIGNVTSYSTSVNSRLLSLETSTGSLNAFTQSTSQSLWELYSSSTNHESRIDYIEGVAFGGIDLNAQFATLEIVTSSLKIATASLQLFTESAQIRLNNLETTSASLNISISNINTFTASISTASLVTSINNLNIATASLQTTSESVNTRLNLIETSTGSLNTYTSSLKSAISLNGSNVTILGDLNVQGATTIIETTTLSVKDNIVELNYGGTSTNAGIITRDVTGASTISGSLLWDATNDYWMVGKLGTESKILTDGMSVISGSSQIVSLLPSGVVSGSAQLPSGVVSGSSQITLSSTTGGGTSANVQFGSLGIGTTASGVSGELRATGDIVAFYSSDERLKENITPIENAVEKINQMGGYNYNWKEGFETIHSHKGHDFGVIAQEVQSVFPEMVTERETGYLAVDYIKLVPVLIEAIKELSAKVTELENK